MYIVQRFVSLVLCSASVKRKLSYIGTAVFVINFNNFSCSCVSMPYRVMKNVGVGHLEGGVRVYLGESISDI